MEISIEVHVLKRSLTREAVEHQRKVREVRFAHQSSADLGGPSDDKYRTVAN